MEILLKNGYKTGIKQYAKGYWILNTKNWFNMRDLDQPANSDNNIEHCDWNAEISFMLCIKIKSVSPVKYLFSESQSTFIDHYWVAHPIL